MRYPMIGIRLDDGRVAKFAPEPADGDEHRIGEGVGVLVPDLLQKILGSEEGLLRSHKCFEDPELLDGKV